MQTDLQEVSTQSYRLNGNILNTCRLCMLTGSTRMESIFQVLVRVTAQSNVAEKIASVTHLSPCEGDGLPSVVCQQCLFQLDVADTFIQRCKQSDTFFRSLLTQEQALIEDKNGTSKRTTQPMTSISASIAGSLGLASTEQLQETAPNVRMHETNAIQIKSEPSECEFEQRTHREQGVPAERRVEPVAVDYTIEKRGSSGNPGSGNEATEMPATECESKDKRETLQPKPSQQRLKCTICLTSYNDPRSLALHKKTHKKQQNSEASHHVEQQSHIPRSQPQQSLAVTEPKTAAQPEEAHSSKATLLVTDNSFGEDKQGWQCSDCGMIIDQRTATSRHKCRTFLLPRPASMSSAPVSHVTLARPRGPRTYRAIKLSRRLLPGQLQQLQMTPKVVLRMPAECQAADNRRKPGGSGGPKRRNYLQERRKMQLLHEIIELKRMRQRLQARMVLAAEVENPQPETTKLKQLKWKLKTKLQQPLPMASVMCSPNVSGHLALADSGSGTSDPLSSVQVKVEPRLLDEVPLVESPRRTKRRLQEAESAQSTEQSSGSDVSSIDLADSLQEGVKSEPELDWEGAELVVGNSANQGGRATKAKQKCMP